MLKRLRRGIVAALWVGGALLAALVIALVAWLLLSLLGDSSGSTVAARLSAVLLVCFATDVVALVVLLALVQLDVMRIDGGDGESSSLV